MKPSIIQQMIGQLTCIRNILAPDALYEIERFVKSCQNTDGGFNNRSGQSDPYYSLFGFLLASALGFDVELERLSQYVSSKRKTPSKSLADECPLIIMDAMLNKRKLQWAKALGLLSKLSRKENRTAASYSAFMVLITLETLVRQPTLMKYAAKQLVGRIEADEAMPCSQVAALLVLKHKLGVGIDAEKQLLRNYSEEESGFKIYPQMGIADLLSTAVALFSMKLSGLDVRLYAPSSVSFVEEQYSNGAFLSGNGDETRDVEYTFYGMLALTSVG